MDETFVDLLRARAGDRGPDRYLLCGDSWLSYGDVAELAAGVAGGLFEAGVRPGDRIAVLLPNRQELLESFFGIAWAGGTFVPLNAYLKGEFLRHQLADSGATVLITDRPGLRAARPVLASADVRHVFVVDSPADRPAEAADDLESDGAIPFVTLHDAAPRAQSHHASPSDIAAIMYTSGTTGPAKGCTVSYGYFTTIGGVMVGEELVVPGDRIFTAMPLFHLAALGRVLNALVAPASMVIEPRFSAGTHLKRAREVGATVLFGVGPMAEALLAQPRRADDAELGLRLATFTPMTPASSAAFTERFGVQVISETYGQTECAPSCTTPVRGPRRAGTVGRAAPHLIVEVHDESDRPVAPGEVGEIVVRSKVPFGMFSGYWNNGAATAETWRNLWHHTGDLARVDEDGFLTFVDRMKDALRRRGENVSSQELEKAIVTHPAIEQAAVVGAPSPLGEDDIHAHVVCGPGEVLDPGDFFTFLVASVPYFALPRYVTVRSELPVTATGRVQKHRLRDLGITENTWDYEELGMAVAPGDRR